METGLCPRCGSRVYFIRGIPWPYCNECGWNLDQLYKGRHKNNRTFTRLVCGVATLICVPVIIHNPIEGLLFLGGALSLTIVLIFFIGQSKPNHRLLAARQAAANTEGADLSSAAPDTMPERVAAYGKALRSIPLPRKVRLIGTVRAAILALRAIAAALAFVGVRDLLFPRQRIVALSDAV